LELKLVWVVHFSNLFSHLKHKKHHGWGQFYPTIHQIQQALMTVAKKLSLNQPFTDVTSEETCGSLGIAYFLYEGSLQSEMLDRIHEELKIEIGDLANYIGVLSSKKS
jgi:hypothetical protein